MVWDSWVWKDQLRRDLRALKTKLNKAAALKTDESLEQAGVAIEKFAFTSAFIVRKLIEAKKLSDELENSSITLQAFPRVKTERHLDFLNWHHIDRFYDVSHSTEVKLRVRELCHLLVHSFVFTVLEDPESCQFDSILFNSEHTKNKILYRMTLTTLFDLILAVTRDDVATMRYNRRTGTLKKPRHTSSR